MRQTNPIWWGPIAPNKPNLAGRPGPWRSKYAKRSQSSRRGWAVLARPRQADCAKQSQTWAGWGIWVEAKGAYCVKRSQSGAAHLASAGELCRTNAIWPSRWAGRSPGGRNAPNEPNLRRFKRLTTEAQRSQRRSSIQGKDRSDLIPPWPRCLRGGDSRQTKPNLGRMGYLGGRQRGILCQTKPISGSPPAIRRRTTPNEPSLAKPVGGPEPWRSKCVKRSQFPGNPQLSLDFVLRNLYFRVFPERGEGTALLRLQIRDGPSAVSQPLVCDSPCAIPDTGCDSDRKTVRNSGKRRMSE
jgi:hypothetical protein